MNTTMYHEQIYTHRPTNDANKMWPSLYLYDATPSNRNIHQAQLPHWMRQNTTSSSINPNNLFVAESPQYCAPRGWHPAMTSIQHHHSYNLFKIDDIELRCSTCKQQFSTVLTLQRHMSSQKHATRIKNMNKTKRSYRRKNTSRYVQQSVTDDIEYLNRLLVQQNAEYVLDDLEDCFNDKENLFANIEPSTLPDLLQLTRSIHSHCFYEK